MGKYFKIILLLSLFFMTFAGTKISDLSQETNIQDTDEVLIRRGANNYRAQVQYLPSANPSDQFNKIKNAYYVSTNASVTDHADTAQSGSIADIITNEMSGVQGDIVLPGNKTYQIKQTLTIPATARLMPQKGAIIDTDISIRDANYKWTLSGSGTSEYYLEAAAGGNPNINEPDDVAEDDSLMTEATVGSLSAGEWDWGNNDTLGFNTVYVRLSDSTDPDGKATDYAEAGYALTVNGPFDVGLYQAFSGNGKIIFGIGSCYEAKTSWFGNNATALKRAIVSIESTVGRLVTDNQITLSGSGTYLVQITKPFYWRSNPMNPESCLMSVSAGCTATSIIEVNPAVSDFFGMYLDGIDLQTADTSYDGTLFKVNYDTTHNVGYFNVVDGTKLINYKNTATGYALHFNNDSGALNAEGAFMINIENAKIRGGIYGLNMGDSILLDNVKCYGAHPAVEFSQVGGAANFVMINCNVTNYGGCAIVHKAENPKFLYNDIVQEFTYAGTEQALIVFNGLDASNKVNMAEVKGNKINNGGRIAFCIELDYCRDVDIGDNVLANSTGSATKHINITANATDTLIRYNNQFKRIEGSWTNGVIDNAGVGTAGVPVAITSFSNSWVEGDAVNFPVRVIKDAEGYVTLEGFVSGGTTVAATTICTIPVGYRSTVVAHRFAVTAKSVGGAYLFGSILISVDGTVKFYAGDNTMYFNVRFRSSKF